MKKRTKVLACLLVSCMTVGMFSACQKQETNTEETENTEANAQNESGSLEGILVSFSGSDLTMSVDSQAYDFDVSTAKVVSTNMRSGDDIIVHFDGELDGTDTSAVEVVSIDDVDADKNAAKEEKDAVGTLVAITENTITIQQNDGTELMFNSNNCEHDFKNGIREGNWIVVTYIGEIQGTDTKNVSVIKITDNDENKVQEEQQKMEIKAVNETVYATAGVHIRESYTTDSKVVGSLAKGASITRTGVCDNGWSRVQYNGADAYVYGKYLTTTAPAADAAPAKTTGEPAATPQQGSDPAPVQQPQEEPEPEQKTATGTVEEVSMNTLSFNVDGQVYTVNIMDAAHQYANGIQTGNTVQVTYTGDLANAESVVVIKVEDDDPNTAAADAVYTGTIVDGTMNTITITTDDGAQMIFDKESAVDNVSGDETGTRVTITADMTLSDVANNIYVAKQIDPA